MRKLILIGDEASKRTVFLRKAADSLGVVLEVLGWDSLQEGFDPDCLTGERVKIDPPTYQTADLFHMQKYLTDYQNVLQKLALAECRFLNSPDAVLQVLDKGYTKRCLQERLIPATQMISEDVRDIGQLLDTMHMQHCHRVFLKPGFFSGAAGVAALSVHPVRGQMVVHTSCRMENGRLVNTKKLFRMENQQEIRELLERLLQLGCIVERWHPKCDFQGKSYDLRVVFQFGHIAHIVVRRSTGPITNLHLNNQALSVQELGLREDVMQEIAQVCRQAVESFPGLVMAGIDILLEKETMRPYIIEMNGQGDLIYQDIYGDNRIYREQVSELCREQI